MTTHMLGSTTRRVDISGRPTIARRGSTPSIPSSTLRRKTTHAWVCAALWFVTTVVFGGLFAWASLRDPTESGLETCHDHEDMYDGWDLLGHDSFFTRPNDGDCCSYSHSNARYCAYKTNSTTCVHYIGTACYVSKSSGRRLSETSEESLHIKAPSPLCSAPSPGICVYDVRNWTTHRHLHANLSAQEQHLFASHDSSHAHQYTDCTHAANASELVHRPNGKVNVSTRDSGSGEVSGESGSGNIVQMNEHGSLNQTGNHCVSSVITYKVPIDEILSLDYEHTLVSVEMDIRPKRPSTCPPDAETCQCNDGDQPCTIDFEHGSFIRIALSEDTCRKSSWKYALVYTGDNRHCYTIEEIDSHNLTITYNVTGTADCIDGFARTHSDDQAQPINDTMVTSRMFEQQGECMCKRDCIFGYELCADTSECERICQQESMDEYLQEHHPSRSRALRSGSGKLQLVKLVSQHLFARLVNVDGIEVLIESGLVIQAEVDVLYRYGFVYFHVTDISRKAGMTLYKPLILAQFDVKKFVQIPDLGWDTHFSICSLVHVTVSAEIGVYAELEGKLIASVDFYHVGTDNGVTASTEVSEFPGGGITYSHPLPYKYLDQPLKEYLEHNHVDLDKENNFDLYAQLDGVLFLGLVAGVYAYLHVWFVHFRACAGVVAGALLKLDFEEETRVKLWSKIGEPEVSEYVCLRMMIGLLVGVDFNLNGHAHIAADFWSLYDHTWGRCPPDHRLPAFDTPAQDKLTGDIINQVICH